MTLPNIRWGLMYGVILTNARAMGEFGAVSVISGNIIGKTQTLTLFVESAYKVRNCFYFALPYFKSHPHLHGLAPPKGSLVQESRQATH